LCSSAHLGAKLARPSLVSCASILGGRGYARRAYVLRLLLSSRDSASSPSPYRFRTSLGAIVVRVRESSTLCDGEHPHQVFILALLPSWVSLLSRTPESFLPLYLANSIRFSGSWRHVLPKKVVRPSLDDHFLAAVASNVPTLLSRGQ